MPINPVKRHGSARKPGGSSGSPDLRVRPARRQAAARCPSSEASHDRRRPGMVAARDQTIAAERDAQGGEHGAGRIETGPRACAPEFADRAAGDAPTSRRSVPTNVGTANIQRHDTQLVSTPEAMKPTTAPRTRTPPQVAIALPKAAGSGNRGAQYGDRRGRRHRAADALHEAHADQHFETGRKRGATTRGRAEDESAPPRTCAARGSDPPTARRTAASR